MPPGSSPTHDAELFQANHSVLANQGETYGSSRTLVFHHHRIVRWRWRDDHVVASLSRGIQKKESKRRLLTDAAGNSVQTSLLLLWMRHRHVSLHVHTALCCALFLNQTCHVRIHFFLVSSAALVQSVSFGGITRSHNIFL